MVKIFSSNGCRLSSWHRLVVSATPNELISVLGCPHSTCGKKDAEKVSLKWTFETEDGIFFTIYDWKEYGHQAFHHLNDVYDFHIGVEDKIYNDKVRDVLIRLGLTVKEEK